MGRIQRKKPSEAKKKKQTVEKSPAVGTQPADGRVVKKAAPGDPAAHGKNRMQALLARKPSPATGPSAVKPRDNFISKAAQFLREVKVELKKVTWPSRKQTIGSTVVVIALVMLISIFLGAVDLGLSSLIRIVLQ